MAVEVGRRNSLFDPGKFPARRGEIPYSREPENRFQRPDVPINPRQATPRRTPVFENSLLNSLLSGNLPPLGPAVNKTL
jgi:hypothetical protein